MQEGEITKEYLYRRENGEDIHDLYATRNCKNEQNRDIIDNDRLGSYDEFGNYFFTPEIKEELMYMPKIVISQSKNENEQDVYDLRSYLPVFGDMFFRLVIGKTAYSLYLIETVNRELGAYVEVYEELVDDTPLVEGETVPIEIIFKNYHILDEDDDDSQIFSTPYDFSHILTRKVYMSLLSKELNEIAQFDDKAQYEEIISVLQSSGEYGERILVEFSERIKERPEIFTTKDTQVYNKSVNEVLLAAVDVVTTEKDKEEPKNKETYLKIQHIRNKKIEKHIEKAHERVDEKYVVEFVNKTVQLFNEKIINKENIKVIEKEDKHVLEFYNKLSVNKKEEHKEINEKASNQEVHMAVPHKLKVPEKPILKQGKEPVNEIDKFNETEKSIEADKLNEIEEIELNNNLTKEEKIALILEKKKLDKQADKKEVNKEVKKDTPAQKTTEKKRVSKAAAQAKPAKKKETGAKKSSKPKPSVKKKSPEKAKKMTSTSKYNEKHAKVEYNLLFTKQTPKTNPSFIGSTPKPKQKNQDIVKENNVQESIKTTEKTQNSSSFVPITPVKSPQPTTQPSSGKSDLDAMVDLTSITANPDTTTNVVALNKDTTNKKTDFYSTGETASLNKLEVISGEPNKPDYSAVSVGAGGKFETATVLEGENPVVDYQPLDMQPEIKENVKPVGMQPEKNDNAEYLFKTQNNDTNDFISTKNRDKEREQNL